MPSWIIPNRLAIGNWTNRNEALGKFDIVVSLIGIGEQKGIDEKGEEIVFTEDPVKYAPIDGVQLIHVNMPENVPGIMFKALGEHAEYLSRAIDMGRKVLVHCNKAKNRSVCFAMGLMGYRGNSPLASYEKVMKEREKSNPKPWHGYIAEVAEYIYQLHIEEIHDSCG